MRNRFQVEAFASYGPTVKVETKVVASQYTNNVNLSLATAGCLSHRIHLVNTIEMQQHLAKLTAEYVHVKITCTEYLIHP